MFHKILLVLIRSSCLPCITFNLKGLAFNLTHHVITVSNDNLVLTKCNERHLVSDVPCVGQRLNV